jgi:hypothetical protein
MAIRGRHRQRSMSLTGLACAGLAFLAVAAAAEPPVHATWTAQPVRLVVAQLSRLAGKPVVLDRRLDPTTAITLVAAGEPCDAVLTAIATRAGGQVIDLAETIRIAPPAVAGRCLAAERVRSQELSRLPKPQRNALAEAAAWHWPAGSRPRDLVATAAAEAGIKVDGVGDIPHDHFPAAELPPLPLADRLDLVLFHFDLRVAWSRSPTGSRPRGNIVSLPDATAAAAVAAPAKRPPRQRPPQPSGTQQVYTLRLEAPLEEALTAISRQLGLRLDLDVASLAAQGIAPREIARADVRSATRDALLDAILTPLALSWRIHEGTLRVWAKPSP